MQQVDAIDLLGDVRIEHEDGGLPAGDVESDQRAVLAVQVRPDLQSLRRVSGNSDRDHHHHHHHHHPLTIVTTVTPSGARTLVAQHIADERIAPRTRNLVVAQNFPLVL